MSDLSAITPIIVTHNNADTIDACLRSLFEHGLKPPIIVDNASTDATLDRLRLHSEKVTVIKNQHNRGFAAACNQGAASATTDYLLFINPDATLTQSPTPALRYLKQHPPVAAAGLRLLTPSGHPEPWSFGVQDVTPLSLLTRKYAHSLKAKSYKLKAKPAAWVSAGALIARQSAFAAVGGFDEVFFMYWEDVDFCRRLRTAGYKVVLIPTVTVRHQRGHSLRNSRHKARIYDQSADSYFQKHYPAYIWLLLRIIRRCYRWLSPHSQ